MNKHASQPNSKAFGKTATCHMAEVVTACLSFRFLTFIYVLQHLSIPKGNWPASHGNTARRRNLYVAA